MSRTLAQKLKELHGAAPVGEADPESAYSSLGTYRPSAGEEQVGREHYTSVGRSRIRDTALPDLLALDAKYGVGTSTSKPKRVKIFDDDMSENEDDEVEVLGSEDEDMSEDEDEDEEQEEGGDDDDGEEEAEEEDVDSEGDSQSEEEGGNLAALSRMGKVRSSTMVDNSASAPRATLDPMAALNASKSKDVEKGRAIRRQQKHFDQILAARIAFQKAWSTAERLPSTPLKRPRPDHEVQAVDDARRNALSGISSLSEKLFRLRKSVPLASSDEPARKRRRADEGNHEAVENLIDGEEYWLGCLDDSLAMVDESHSQLIAILQKWSSKIQAASLQQAGLTAGKSANKFSGNAGITDVVESIETGLSARQEAMSTSLTRSDTDENAFYKTLLREVIEARSGSTSGLGLDSTQLKSEKKLRRDAERGGSKGRRLKFIVHEKAQNFVVPIPLASAWHEEQVDELFSSLLGGAGLSGAGTTAVDAERLMAGENGFDRLEIVQEPLAGLRVF